MLGLKKNAYKFLGCRSSLSSRNAGVLELNFECQVFVLFCLGAYDQLKCENVGHSRLRITFIKTAKTGRSVMIFIQ